MAKIKNKRKVNFTKPAPLTEVTVGRSAWYLEYRDTYGQKICWIQDGEVLEIAEDTITIKDSDTNEILLVPAFEVFVDRNAPFEVRDTYNNALYERWATSFEGDTDEETLINVVSYLEEHYKFDDFKSVADKILARDFKSITDEAFVFSNTTELLLNVLYYFAPVTGHWHCPVRKAHYTMLRTLRHHIIDKHNLINEWTIEELTLRLAGEGAFDKNTARYLAKADAKYKLLTNDEKYDGGMVFAYAPMPFFRDLLAEYGYTAYSWKGDEHELYRLEQTIKFGKYKIVKSVLRHK